MIANKAIFTEQKRLPVLLLPVGSTLTNTQGVCVRFKISRDRERHLRNGSWNEKIASLILIYYFNPVIYHTETLVL